MHSNRYHTILEWGDCDPAGIAFYPRLLAMCDAATAALMSSATGRTRAQLFAEYDALGWPMVDLKTSFSHPVTYDDRVRVDSAFTALGTSSITVHHRMLVDGTLCLECTETRVWTVRDPDSGEITSAPIPEELREMFSTPVS